MSELTDRLRSDRLSDYWTARMEAADLIDAIDALTGSITPVHAFTHEWGWGWEAAMDEVRCLIHPEGEA